MRVRLLVLGAAPVRLAATVIASLPPPLVGLYGGQEKDPAPGCLNRRRGQLDADQFLRIGRAGIVVRHVILSSS